MSKVIKILALEEKTLIFKDDYLFLSAFDRYLFKLFLNLFIIFGIIFSLSLIFLIGGRWLYLGILLFFFFAFILIKKNFSDNSLQKLSPKKKIINLSSYLSLNIKDLLVKTKNFALKNRVSFSLALLYLLLLDRFIEDSFYRIDLTEENLKEILKKILENKLDNDSELSDDSYVGFLKRIIGGAFYESLELKLESIDKEGLFLSLFSLNDSLVEKIFSYGHLEKNDVAVAFILNSLSKRKGMKVISGLSELKRTPFKSKRINVNRALTSRPTPILDKYALDFTQLAEDYKIGIMVGHEEEYEILLNLLSRPDKRNILMIGPSGAGKETIVSYLAYNIIRDNVPPAIRDSRLYALSLVSLFADATSPEEVFNNLTMITKELEMNRDIILYLPDFHTFKLTQQQDKSGLNALDILKPIIFSLTIPIIAATTPENYHRYLEEDPSILENFSILRVKEITPLQAIKIMAYRSLEWEQKSKVKISYKAIKRAVNLAIRFYTNIPLPTSAQNILTEALEGAKRKNKKVLLEQDILDLVSVKTGIPLEVSEQKEKEKLLDLENIIHRYLINQEEAVQLVASALRQYRVGLASEKKPIATFLFVGPTGVGKTELSKTLARVYFGSEKTMIRFDMAQYQDRKSVYYFIGDPEGELDGELTEAVKSNPFSLILLDEFEKAHPEVLNLFLSLFDEGRLTDNKGQVIDFTHTIIIATSNALSEFIVEELDKKTEFKEITEKLKKRLVFYFKPELLNRFDEVVVFKPLSYTHLREIVILKLQELKSSLAFSKKIEINFSEEVIKKIAQLGYNPLFGARPLNAVIRHYIKESLAQIILKEEIEEGKKIEFVLEEGKIVLKIV
ncbi:MAG: AAA family ATPase [Minisyncoccia bacterium]